MNREKMIDRLVCILHSETNYKGDIPLDRCDEYLTGPYFKLTAREMVALFFTIEKEFYIRIDQSDTIDGTFNTINGILDIINRSPKISLVG